MSILKFLWFIAQFALVGLLLGAGYLLWQDQVTPRDISQWLQQQVSDWQPEVTRTSNPHSEGPFSYADAVNLSAPSVVSIYTSRTTQQALHPLLEEPLIVELFGDQLKKYQRDKTERNLGSGVIVSTQGYILTNQHVIDGADEILVALADGRSSAATLVGQDRDTDIAVLQIPLSAIESVAIAADDLPVQVGDVVLAIGNPLNVGQTVTMGIISATGRNRVGLNTFENFLQTDAAIHPGNSGGALVNARGDLIGINTAIFTQSGGAEGIGFAIPVAMALDVMREIIDNGHVRRGWLGVEGTEITAQAAIASGNPDVRGMLIVGVYIDSPADQAGIQTGDVLTAINGQRISRVRDVLDLIAGRKPGDRVNVEILRDGETLELTMVTTERPTQTDG
jgi:Do/DeqQ family serine protease